MCAPLLIVSAALAVAQGVASHVGQAAAQAAQVKYQEDQGAAYNTAAEQNARAANQEYLDAMQAEDVKLMQQEESASVELQNIRKSRLQAQGTALASAEGAGQSLNFLLDDFMRQEADYREVVKSQSDMNRTASLLTTRGLAAQAKNRANSGQRYVASSVTGPSVLATALQIGGGVADAYSKASDYGKKNPFKSAPNGD